MFKLVDIAQAREHLRIDEANDSDAVISTYIDAASGFVLDYVKAPPNAESAMDIWKTDAIPGAVMAATLLVLGELYDNRASGNTNPLSEGVKALLTPHRVPTLA